MNLKVNNKQGKNTIKAIIKGNKCNQQKLISWSYLNLGKVALNHTKKKQNKHDINPNTI